ncbi:MAG: hypothetical protein D6682_06050, partial [Zetaproteobacteria bacterium]
MVHRLMAFAAGRMAPVVVVTLIVSLLSGCGGGGGGASAPAGYTPVTISLGGASVAGGALAPAGTVPAGVVSMSVTAQDAAGATIAGPVTATAANNFTVTFNVPNGSGITFTVAAFDGANVKLYQGVSASQNLTGVPINVPVTMQVWLGGVAAAGAPLAGTTLTVRDSSVPAQTLILTTDAAGRYQGAVPANFVYPLLLKVIRPGGLPPIYAMMTRTGRINTTTLSTLVTAQAIGAPNSAAIDAGFPTAAAQGNATLDRQVQSGATRLMQQLGLTAFTRLGAKNPLTDPTFKADGTGLDAVMDALDLKERDEDGDGTPDLVLANRSPAATPVVSVKSTAPQQAVREPYSFAIPGTAVAGDDIYGTPVTGGEAVVSTAAGAPVRVPLGAMPAALRRQEVNKLVASLIASAEEAGVDVGNASNGRALGSFVARTIQSVTPAAGALSTTALQQAAAATRQVFAAVTGAGGVLGPAFDPYAAAQQASSAVVSAADTVPPLIVSPADVYIEATGPRTPYALAAPAVTDLSPFTLTSNAPADFPLGTTSVVWTATDAYGNTGSAVQHVVVQDTT